MHLCLQSFDLDCVGQVVQLHLSQWYRFTIDLLYFCSTFTPARETPQRKINILFSLIAASDMHTYMGLVLTHFCRS